MRNEIIAILEGANPNQILYKDGDKTYTVSSILKESSTLALQLQAEGFKKDDRVVMVTEMGVGFIKLMFATMMLQCKVAIIDPHMGRDNYQSKLDQFDPQWVFLDSRIKLLQNHPILRQAYFTFKKNGVYFPPSKKIKRILTGPKIWSLQKDLHISDLPKLASTQSPVLSKEISSFPFLITYTSGTLSQPKGVLHTTAGLANSIEKIAKLIQSDQAQTLVTHLPHFMLIGACAGISVKLWKEDWSVKKKLQFILEENITTLFAPPAEYQAMISYCRKKKQKLPKTLKHILLGSAPVHQSFLNRLITFLPQETRITCTYGMTENLLVAVIDGRKKASLASDGDPLGFAADGVQIKIADDGEILIKSNQMFKQYWELESAQEWHHTGDLGYLDKDGLLVLKGRKKDMIIRRDFNIYPALYEPSIKKIDGVMEAALVGIYDEDVADEKVHLFVESKEDIAESELRTQLQLGPHSIDKDALPDHIHFVKIPRLGRQQKIDKKELRQRALRLVS